MNRDYLNSWELRKKKNNPESKTKMTQNPSAQTMTKSKNTRKRLIQYSCAIGCLWFASINVVPLMSKLPDKFIQCNCGSSLTTYLNVGRGPKELNNKYWQGTVKAFCHITHHVFYTHHVWKAFCEDGQILVG